MKKLLIALAVVLILRTQVCGQATVVQSPTPQFRSFLASGAPNASGCVYTFASGTSTPQATYTDNTGNTANANPVILDSTGSANIWITGVAYRFQVWSFGSGTVGTNCGNGTQLYQIDGVKDTGLTGFVANLAAVVTINTATNQPTITTVNPAGANQNYNIPDPGTGGNFVINPSGNSGTANTLDCTLSGITCKRTANFYFRGAQCNGSTATTGFDTINSGQVPQALCVTGNNIQKGVLGFQSAYTHVQKNTGTSNAATTITTTYPATIAGGTGDLVVLSVAFNATTTITGCTDGTNAYTQAKHQANGALSLDIWYFLNPTTKAAGTTLTCTFSAAATGALLWHEYVAPSSVNLDVTANNFGTGTAAPTGTTASLAQSPELVFGAVGNINNASEVVNTAFDTGCVDHGFVASNSIAVVDDAGVIAQSLSGQTISFTLGSSQAWAGAIATFKGTNVVSTVAQQTINLPLFWNSAVNVNSTLKWSVSAAPTGTSNAVLGAAIVCTPDGTTDDSAFNADTTNTVTISTTGPNLPTSTALNGLVATGCAAGNLMHFQVKRLRYNAADTYEGYINLIGAQLQIGITQ